MPFEIAITWIGFMTWFNLIIILFVSLFWCENHCPMLIVIIKVTFIDYTFLQAKLRFWTAFQAMFNSLFWSSELFSSSSNIFILYNLVSLWEYLPEYYNFVGNSVKNMTSNWNEYEKGVKLFRNEHGYWGGFTKALE